MLCRVHSEIRRIYSKDRFLDSFSISSFKIRINKKLCMNTSIITEVFNTKSIGLIVLFGFHKDASGPYMHTLKNLRTYFHRFVVMIR